MTDHTMRFERRDDETLEVFFDGEPVGYANHDEHGWAGIVAIEYMAKNIAKLLGITVEES